MQKTASKAPPRRRKATKAVRQRQLIDATIASIAKRGFASTTLGEVAKTAGLSQGIVNLHFTNKETLLVKTLRYLRDEYRQAWQNADKSAPDDAAARLGAIVDIDFHPSVCDPKKLAVWFAFIGEAKSRPLYQSICEKSDIDRKGLIVSLCRELIEQGGYLELDAVDVASGFTSMSEGLWLSILVAPEELTAQDAQRICQTYFKQFFPKHFPIGGERETR